MIDVHTIDVTNVKKILKCCPYYDDIINYDIDYTDELSFDLIDWYKDLIFSCNGDDEKETKVINKIDKSMYLYVNNITYQKGLKKIINSRDIDLNSGRSTKKLIRKILDYTRKYEEVEILNITSSRWL